MNPEPLQSPAQRSAPPPPPFVEPPARRAPDPRAVGLLATIILGSLDVLSGPELTMSHFYAVTVVYVAWTASRRGAVVMATMCAAVALLADHLVSEPYLVFTANSFSSEAVPLWNGLSRFVVYVVIAYAVSELRAIVAERERLIAELRETAANLRKLEGILPMCAWCKKVRDESRDGAWTPMDAYIATHTDASFSHGICPACAGEHFTSGEEG